MDELEYYSNQFLEEYMLLKTAYNLRFRLKTKPNEAILEIYEVVRGEMKRVIKVEEESQEEAYRAACREIERFITFQNMKKEKEREQNERC